IVGIDEAGNEVILDREDVELSILQGEAFGTVTDQGQLDLQSESAASQHMEGVVIVKAALAVSDDYTFEDAVVVHVDLDGKLPTVPTGSSSGGSSGSISDSLSENEDESDHRGGEIDQQMEELLRSLIE